MPNLTLFFSSPCLTFWSDSDLLLVGSSWLKQLATKVRNEDWLIAVIVFLRVCICDFSLFCQMSSVGYKLSVCLCLFFARILTFLFFLLTGCPQVCSHRWRCQEATSVSSWNCCPSRNSQVSKIHRPPDPQGTIPAPCAWNRSGLQVWSSFSVYRCPGLARSQWSILGWIVWGYQPLRDPCKACHNHAQGYSVGTPHPWRTRLNRTCVFDSENKTFFEQILGILTDHKGDTFYLNK